MEDALEAAYRTHGPRALATLVRLLGDFDAAEEALHDAFVAAALTWPRDGTPTNPCAWLVSTGRFRTIDRWRRHVRAERALAELEAMIEHEPIAPEPGYIADDMLRLIFTCCHPALVPDARIALTLREVGGLTTEEIARAYLTRAPTIAQRIVRAKAKLREDAIPYETPSPREWPERTECVLHVVYLIFNEGYGAGPASPLAREAIRLGHLIARLIDDTEARGLLALMLLHDARAAARFSADGELVLLQDQDRSLWNRAQIAEGAEMVEQVCRTSPVGAYTLQAAIAATHAGAASFATTDWAEIVALYDLLARAEPSPVVGLNRAVAISMRDGAEAGLAEIEIVAAELEEYPPALIARADALRRLGRRAEAADAYQRAHALLRDGPERRFVARRIEALRD